MQRAQFEMGQDQVMPETTYTEKIDGSAILGSAQSLPRLNNAELALKHRKTNITLGNDGKTDISEFKESFGQPLTRNSTITQSQDLLRSMKTPHFSIGQI